MTVNPYAHWSDGGRETQAWNEGHAAGVVEAEARVHEQYRPLLAALHSALDNGEFVAHTDATIRGHLAALNTATEEP